MKYYEVRLVLEALDDVDARLGVSDHGYRTVLAAARQEAAA
jgi:hypothetical protein